MAKRRALAGVASLVLTAVVLIGVGNDPAHAAVTAVRVSGNSLIDQNGVPLRLLGVNRSGAEYACIQGWGIFDGPVDATSVAAIASWHVNAVRVPLNEDCWLGINGVNPSYGGANYRTAIGNYVQTLHNAGFVVTLDLHWNAPGSTPATGQQVMADADHSVNFWASVASYFVHDPAIIFDLYNEPHDISWTCWRDGCTTSGGWQAAGMQSLINGVRFVGATQPVLVGGNGWGGDLSSWLTYKPTDPLNQMVASIHIYNFSACTTASCWSSTIAPVAASYPVITGELGENDCASSFINSYMSWADTNKVSYLGWTWDVWDCRNGPALITSYDGTPTNFGLGFRDHLTAITSPTTTTTTTSGSTTTSSSSTTTTTQPKRHGPKPH